VEEGLFQGQELSGIRVIAEKMVFTCHEASNFRGMEFRGRCENLSMEIKNRSKTILSHFMQLTRNFLIFNKFGAVQKEIDGILSPNNIWPSVFCSLGNKKLGADCQL
jgi:hypothetical protein